MAQFKTTEIILDHKFEPKTCRHSINDMVHVLHCHHFATLYSRLADDCGMLDGKKLLAEVSEDTFSAFLTCYYEKNTVQTIAEKITIAEQYYAATGLGQMQVICAGMESGEVNLLHSHVDEGWIKKWGKRDQPVNFITAGYIAGMFNALFGCAPRTYHVVESESIVSGAEQSKFEVVMK